MRALLFEHESSCGLGRLDQPIAARGISVEVVSPNGIGSLADPRSYDLAVTLGSDRSAYDDSIPWVADEFAYVQRLVEAGVPVLGICFGAQMLARALGAEVRRAAAPEVGWKWITRTGDSSTWLPAGPWFMWHEDTFAWPPDATPLAWSDAAPQAFARGSHLGIQFHPEATTEIIEQWLHSGRRKLDLHGVDAEALRDKTRALADRAHEAATTLFDTYLDRLLGR